MKHENKKQGTLLDIEGATPTTETPISAETFQQMYEAVRLELAKVKLCMLALLKQVGEPALCKGCGDLIFWVWHVHTDRNTPYNGDGSNHFSTCPKAQQFKRSSKEKPNVAARSATATK